MRAKQFNYLYFIILNCVCLCGSVKQIDNSVYLFDIFSIFLNFSGLSLHKLADPAAYIFSFIFRFKNSVFMPLFLNTSYFVY